MTDHYPAIGIDIGGTKIAGALVERSGRVLHEYTVPTLAHEPPERVVERIAEVVNNLIGRSSDPISGVGLACPGPVDPEAGVARKAVNLGWENLPLLDMLRGQLTAGEPPDLYLQNDVNALALGEMLFGAALHCDNFVLIAPGTGLGGGAVVDGEVLTGSAGTAMEIGHVVVVPDGRPCRCGLRGCAERYVSGVGLTDAAEAHGLFGPDGRGISSHDLLRLAGDGDGRALSIIQEAADALASVMAFTIAVTNPELVVIGGGLGRAAYDLLVPRAWLLLQSRVMPEALQQVEVRVSQVESSALGSAALVWHRHNQGD